MDTNIGGKSKCKGKNENANSGSGKDKVDDDDDSAGAFLGTSAPLVLTVAAIGALAHFL